MSKGAINFSSDNEYYTSKEIVEIFGKFQYDPATTKEKAEIKCEAYEFALTKGAK